MDRKIYQKVHPMIIGMMLTLLCLQVEAQEEREMRWQNVTSLTFAASNGTDKENALQQYLLFDEAVLYKHQDLYAQLETFSDEFTKNLLSQAVPEKLKEIDQTIADFKKKMKEIPQMAENFKEGITQMEATKKQIVKEYATEAVDYTYDPATLLQNLTQIAVNKKAYTEYKDIGGGLFAVKTGPCYGPLEPDVFNRVKTEEKYEYTWGAIDYNGKTIIEPKYRGLADSNPEWDIIFLETRGEDGTICAGARGYDGRVRIPFIYSYRTDITFGDDFCVYAKNGKFGFVSFEGKELQPCEFRKPEYFAYGWAVSKDGKNYGVIERKEGKLVIPLKYKCFWDCINGEIQMQRHDGKIDVYNEKYQFVRTEELKD